MSSPDSALSPAEAARTAAVDRVMGLEGVTAVFPPALAVVRSLTTRSSAPHDALVLSSGAGPVKAAIDIGVTGPRPATEIATDVQELVRTVLDSHGIETASVAVTVLEYSGRPGTERDL